MLIPNNLEEAGETIDAHLPKVLVIPEPHLTQPAPGTWRVTAEVEGQEIYFESAAQLAPRIEAFVCPLLLPAMTRGLELDVQAPLSAAMLENLQRVRAIGRQWWPRLAGGEVKAPLAPGRSSAVGKGLFFTGGIDSSFALCRLEGEVSNLVYVEGFDIKLADEPRLQRMRESLRRVADATSRQLTIVRTNLRDHSLFKALDWETAHGAALAAVAHTLGQWLGTMYVADSDVPPPYGSHPDLDPLWSSDSMALTNFGSGQSRLQRAAAISQWPPMRGHLHVCWEKLAETLNCGCCKKCVLTRLELLAAGDPTGMDSFPDVPLAATLENLVRTNPGTHYPHFWRETHAALDDPQLRALIEALLIG